MAIELQVRSDSRQAQIDLRKLDKSVENINKTTQNATKAIKGLAIGAAGAFAAIGAAKAVTNLTDSYRRLEARIALATDGLKEQQKAFKQLNKIAVDTRSNQEGVADLYSRIARATKSLGIEQKTVIDVTRSISKAITISGASAESANSAIVQLGQGLAAGALRGQELNSVMEQTPAVAQAIARGMGITIGELRAFANEGKLTAEAVVNALKDQGKAIDEEFNKVPLTFAQSLTVLGIGVGRVVNEIDQVVGATQGISAAARNLGINLNSSAEGIGAVVQIMVNRFSLFLSGVKDVAGAIGDLGKALGSLGVAVFERLIPISLINTLNFFLGKLKEIAFSFKTLAAPSERLSFFISKLALSIENFTASIKLGPLQRLGRYLSFGFTDSIISVSMAYNFLEVKTTAALESIIRITKLAMSGIATGFIKTSKALKHFGNEITSVFSSVDTSSLKDLVKEVVDFGGDLLSKGLKSVIKFTDTVKDLFFDVYDKVVGNSYWPDMVDGVNNYAKNLSKGEGIVKKFANSVSSTFESLSTQSIVAIKVLLAFVSRALSVLFTLSSALTNMGSLTFDGIKESLARLANDLVSGFTVIQDKIGQAVAIGLLLGITAFTLTLPAKAFIIGTALTSGIVKAFDKVLGTLGTSFQEVAFEAGRAAGAFTAAIIAEIPALIQAIAQIGRGFIEGFLNSIPLIGGLLSGVVKTVDTFVGGLGSLAAGGLLISLFFGSSRSAAVAIITSTIGKIVTFAAVKLASLSFISEGAGAVITGLVGPDKGAVAMKLLKSYFANVIALMTSFYSTVAATSVGTSAAGGLTSLMLYGKNGAASILAGLASFITVVGTTLSGLLAALANSSAGNFLGSLFYGKGSAIVNAQTTTSIGISAAQTLASTIKRKFASMAGPGGLLRKALFGAGGIALLLSSTGAFASDAADATSSPFTSLPALALEGGLLGLAMFGTGGIKKGLAVIASGITKAVSLVMTALTSILLHPVFLTIAAIVAAISLVGLLGLYLFGEGNSFDRQLDNAQARILGIVGLLDNTIDRGDRQDFTSDLIGEQNVPDSRAREGLGKQDDGLRSTFDDLASKGFSVDALSDSDFNTLAVSIADGVRIQTSLLDANLMSNTDLSTISKLQGQVLEQNKATVSLLRELDASVQEQGASFVKGDEGSRDILNLEAGFIEAIFLFSARVIDSIGNFVVNLPSLFVRGLLVIKKALIILAQAIYVSVIEPILNFFGSIFGAIGDLVSAVITITGTVITSVFETIVDFFSGIGEFFDDPKKFFKDLVTSTKEVAASGAGTAITTATDVKDAFKDAIKAAIDAAPALLDPAPFKRALDVEGFISGLADSLNIGFGNLGRDISQEIDIAANKLNRVTTEFKIELPAETTRRIAELQTAIASGELKGAELAKAGVDLLTAINKGIVTAVGIALPARLSKVLTKFGFEISKLDLQLLGTEGMANYTNLIENLEQAQDNLAKASTEDLKVRAQELIAAQQALILESIALEQKTRGKSGAVDGLESVGLEVDLEQFSKYSDFAQAELIKLSDKALGFTRILENKDGQFTFEQLTEAQAGLNAITREAERLNEVLGRGDELAEAIRDSFQETVQGIFDGANDIGDIFDNIGKQILSTFNDIASQGITDMIFGKKGEEGESGGLGGFLGGIFGSDDSAKGAQDPGKGGIGGMISGAVDSVKGVFGFGGKEGETATDTLGSAAAVLPGADKGADSMLGGMLGGMAPDGTEMNPYFVRIVEGMMGGLMPAGEEGGGLGGLGGLVTGAGEDEDSPEGKAAGALEQFTTSIGGAVDGMKDYVGGIISQVLEFFGLTVASTASTVATTKEAGSKVLGVVAGDALTSAMAKAAIAAEILGSAMAAAAAKSIAGFSTGGAVSGPGTGTSDSILAHLSNGEYVINAKSTKKYGPLIEAINSGNVPKFATGGEVGGSLPVMNSDLQASMISKAGSKNSSGPSQLNNTVTLQVTGDVTEATRKAVRDMGNEIATNVQSQFAERGVLGG